MVVLQTASEVIDALGGTSAAAKLVRRFPQTMTRARKLNRLPAGTFRAMTKELSARGLSAPPELWGQE
jgi:hypothetical protein